MKWERANQSELNRGKNLLKLFHVIWVVGKCRKDDRFFSNFLSFCFPFQHRSSMLLYACWVSNWEPHWVKGHRLVVYTFLGTWVLMPPDTPGSISRGRIIWVMQKSSGPGIAWGLSSGNPNNFHLIEFPMKNAKIIEWIRWVVCLVGLQQVVWNWLLVLLLITFDFQLPEKSLFSKYLFFNDWLKNR